MSRQQAPDSQQIRERYPELPPTGSHKDDPSLIVTKDQVQAWMAEAGYKPVQEFNGLNEGKWFVVYARK